MQRRSLHQLLGRCVPFHTSKGLQNVEVRAFSSDPVKGTIPQGGVGVAVSQYAYVERSYSEEDVLTFGGLICDRNPLHQTWRHKDSDEDLPKELESHPLLTFDDGNSSSKAIVHGMFLSSLFSSIFGTLVPGAIYMNQTLNFRAPVYVEEVVVGRVDVLRVRKFRARGVIVTCNTRVLRGETECVTGKADVWLPSGSKLS